MFRLTTHYCLEFITLVLLLASLYMLFIETPREFQELGPEDFLGILMWAAIIPLCLIGSAIRSLIRKKATKWEHVSTEAWGGGLEELKFQGMIIQGQAARKLAYQRLVLPVSALLLVILTLALNTKWTEPFQF